MSFDLYFFRESNGRPLEQMELYRFCERYGPYFRVGGNQLLYYNGDTAAQFTMTHAPLRFDEDVPADNAVDKPDAIRVDDEDAAEAAAIADDESLEAQAARREAKPDQSQDAAQPVAGTDLPEPYTAFVDAHLQLTINFLRPSFFADETMRFAAALCEGLNVLVSDPQGREAPHQPDADELTRSWLRSEQAARNAILSEEGSVEVVWNRPDLLKWHQYQFHRSAIAEAAGEKAHVPNLAPAALRSEPTRIRLVGSIEYHAANVLPQCDWVTVQRTERFFFGLGKSTRSYLLDAGEVHSRLRQWLKTVDTPIGPMQVLPRDQAEHLNALEDLSPPVKIDALEPKPAERLLDEFEL